MGQRPWRAHSPDKKKRNKIYGKPPGFPIILPIIVILTVYVSYILWGEPLSGVVHFLTNRQGYGMLSILGAYFWTAKELHHRTLKGHFFYHFWGFELVFFPRKSSLQLEKKN